MKLAESANNKVANFSLPRPDGNANSLSTSQYVTFYEAGPILLTCPHSIRLKRDDHEDHKPEPLVLDLIKLFTIEFGPTKASSVFWSNAASKNFSNNRDPNYLHIKELKSNPWHNCLKTHQQRHGAIAIHFDFHGMRGKKHGSDLAMGIEPLERFLSEEPYTQIPFVLEEELRSILEPRGFVVKQVPSMSGFRTTQRMTLSQQSVMCLKVPAVQIEMSMKLREALLGDRDLRKQFRGALVECYKTFLKEMAALRCTTVAQMRLQCAQRKQKSSSMNKQSSFRRNGSSSSTQDDEKVPRKDSLSPRAKQKSKRRKEREKRERILSNPCIRFFFCIPPLDELTEEEERIQSERDRLRKKLRENRKIAPLGSSSSSSSIRY